MQFNLVPAEPSDCIDQGDSEDVLDERGIAGQIARGGQAKREREHRCAHRGNEFVVASTWKNGR